MIILPTFRGCLASVAFSPSQIPGLGLWLDASAITGLGDGDALSTWNDLSGAGRNGTNSGAACPVYKTNIVNGRPVVRFDGVDDVLNWSPAALLNNVSGATVFTVMKWRTSPSTPKQAFIASVNGGPNARVAINGGVSAGKVTTVCRRLDADAGSNATTAASITTSNFYIHEGLVNFSGGTISTYVNGTQDGSATFAGGNTSATDSTSGCVGAAPTASAYADIDIAEILIWPSALSPGDRALVRAYLAAKYAISAA